MGIKTIQIRNLLSFKDVTIKELEDINCIVGLNNVGKSNLLKLLDYFYKCLRDEPAIPPKFNNPYSKQAIISITYDTKKIGSIITSRKAKSNFQKHIYQIIFEEIYEKHNVNFFSKMILAKNEVTLKLYIRSDNSIGWSVRNREFLSLIDYLYPFFKLESRHLQLHNWDSLWDVISKLKAFKVNNVEHEKVVDYIDELLSANNQSYKDFISKIKSTAKTFNYSYQEKVLNYVKIGLKGHTFNVNGNKLETQSDGTVILP